LKDRNAVAAQWFSVGLAGRPEPDWYELENAGDVEVLAVARHRRKLRRGVHRANRFTLVLRELQGEPARLQSRLQQLRGAGVPNYFGEQRFGRDGATLEQALCWMRGSRRVSRAKRGLYLSALRAYVFNVLLAQRVESGDWNTVAPGDVCLLRGTRSFFTCEDVDDDILMRLAQGDLHPGLPLWGEGKAIAGLREDARVGGRLAHCREICEFLETSGTALAWRAARLLPDDFCWQFCDDDTLRLDFALGAGSYATALMAEFVHYNKGVAKSGRGSERY
jgi:tRNA pseudouridine13 synthase